MELYSIKINGYSNPVGYLLDTLVCSWKVRGATGSRQSMVRIEIDTDPAFSAPLYTLQGAELDSIAQKLDFPRQPRTRYHLRITVTSDTGETASGLAFFETAKQDEPWSAQWIGLHPDTQFHPVFRKRFSCKKSIKQARLYLCGLGLFEAHLNGIQAGNDFLAPFINDYQAHVQYCTYDVTHAIRAENELLVYLGNGWYKGRFGVTGHSGFFGKDFALIAELHLTYADGSCAVIGTDQSWDYRQSPFVQTDIYDGEVQDYLCEQAVSGTWRSAALIAAPAPVIERYSLPVHAMEALPVQKVIHTPAGETVLDFGQNFAGYVECTQTLAKGTVLKLECAEILQDGNFYHDNYKGAKSQFVYISDGVSRLIRPHFTFFGFRYIKITGLEQIDPAYFTGRAVYSEMERTGFITTSHEKLNRLYENCLWSMRSNFLDMPTDCPQRDERLGWTGDAAAFCRTAGYHMDTQAFFQKFLRDLRTDQQRNHGRVAIYMPNTTPGVCSSVWSDIATILPDMCYTYYGNKEALAQNYPLMRDWVEYIHQADVARGVKNLYDFDPQFGDWLALDGYTEQSVWGRTDPVFLSSVFYYASVMMTAQTAETLELPEARDYRQLAADIRAAILREFYTPSGRLSVDTQTGYLLALRFHLYPDKDILLDGLHRRFVHDHGRIRTGFVGTALLPVAFAQNGLVDAFYDLLFYEGYPGWLYAVNLGATTIWERWNSVAPDGHLSGTSMHSLNHYAFGSVIEFLYRYTAGIIPTSPGFRSVRLEPKPNWRLRTFQCSFDSAAGRYVSNWRLLDDGQLTVELEIPFGCTAQVVLPDYAGSDFTLEAGHYTYTYHPLRDFTRPFDAHTPMDVLAHEPQAMAVLQQTLPRMYQALQSGNIDEQPSTLEDELQKTRAVNYPPEKLAQIERAVVDMFCYPEADLLSAIEALKQVKSSLFTQPEYPG